MKTRSFEGFLKILKKKIDFLKIVSPKSPVWGIVDYLYVLHLFSVYLMGLNAHFGVLSLCADLPKHTGHLNDNNDFSVFGALKAPFESYTSRDKTKKDSSAICVNWFDMLPTWNVKYFLCLTIEDGDVTIRRRPLGLVDSLASYSEP